MPQLSLYLDDESMESLRRQAQEHDASLSLYVREVLQQHNTDGWPSDYWDVYGALIDETFVAPESLDFADDTPRREW